MKSPPVIFRDLAPLFHVARIMLVLPFKKFHPTNYSLMTTWKNDLLVAAFQMTIICSYFYYMCLAVSKFSTTFGAVEDASAVTSFTIMIILLFFDACNIVIIMFFCLRACKYVNFYVLMIRRADEILETPSQSTVVKIHMITFVAYFIFKFSLSVFMHDAGIVAQRIGSRFIAGVIMCTEQMLLILCLQLSRRVARLNSILRELAHTVDCRQIRRLEMCFLYITSALGAMTENIGPYLFFNLAQLFLMALCSLLFVVYSCGRTFDNIVAPMQGECSGRAIIFVEVMVRFSLIIIACSKPASLVS